MLRRRLESPDAAHAALVRIAYLPEHRAPFEVSLADRLTFNVVLYRNRAKICYWTGWLGLRTPPGGMLQLLGKKPCLGPGPFFAPRFNTFLGVPG